MSAMYRGTELDYENIHGTAICITCVYAGRVADKRLVRCIDMNITQSTRTSEQPLKQIDIEDVMPPDKVRRYRCEDDDDAAAHPPLVCGAFQEYQILYLLVRAEFPIWGRKCELVLMGYNNFNHLPRAKTTHLPAGCGIVFARRFNILSYYS